MISKRFFGLTATRRQVLALAGTISAGIPLGLLLSRTKIGTPLDYLIGRNGNGKSSEEIAMPEKAKFLFPHKSWLSLYEYHEQFDEVFDAAHNGFDQEIFIGEDRYSEGECKFESPEGKLITLERGTRLTGHKFRYVTISPLKLLTRSNVPGLVNTETIVRFKLEGNSKSNPRLSVTDRKWEYQRAMTSEELLVHITPITLNSFAREFSKAYNWALENGKIIT